MFTVIKRMEISAAHKLILPYRSKCASLHGHNWIITVYCRSERLNADGLGVDFTQIKQAVKEKLDHRNLRYFLLIPRQKILPVGYASKYLNVIRSKCRNRKQIR